MPTYTEWEEQKDADLEKLSRILGGLPSKGIVKLVLDHSDAWRQWCRGDDPRGAANKIGRRISKLYLSTSLTPEQLEKGMAVNAQELEKMKNTAFV